MHTIFVGDDTVQPKRYIEHTLRRKKCKLSALNQTANKSIIHIHIRTTMTMTKMAHNIASIPQVYVRSAANKIAQIRQATGRNE